MLTSLISQFSFLPCLGSEPASEVNTSCSSKIAPQDDPASPDAFEVLAGLIGQTLPQWIPRPISPLTSYKCAMTSLSVIQISGGVLHCFADLYSGTYATLLGVLGFNTARSDRHPDLFKTYLVITFINGCVQGMEVFGNFLVGHASLAVAFPFLLSNGIAYLGWLYVKKQKRLLRDPSYLSVWRAQNYQLIEAAFVAQLKDRSRQSQRLATITEEPDDTQDGRVIGPTGSTGETGERDSGSAVAKGG